MLRILIERKHILLASSKTRSPGHLLKHVCWPINGTVTLLWAPGEFAESSIFACNTGGRIGEVTLRSWVMNL